MYEQNPQNAAASPNADQAQSGGLVVFQIFTITWSVLFVIWMAFLYIAGDS